MSDQRKKMLTWMVGIGVAFLVVGFVWLIIQGAIDRTISSSIVDGQVFVQRSHERLAEADQVYENNHAQFAQHWSDGLEDKLKGARVALEEADRLFAEAEAAFSDRPKRRRDARQLIAQANDQLQSADSVIVVVIGTEDGTQAGLYETLQEKTQNAPTQVTGAQAEIQRVTNLLEHKLVDPWNSEHGLSFEPAFTLLSTAKRSLQEANDARESDPPLAFDKATEAINQARDGENLAIADETNALAAWQAMETARIAIGASRSFVEASTYRQEDGRAALTTAESLLAQAETAFAEERFADALLFANQARDQASDAESRTTRPEDDDDDVIIVVPDGGFGGSSSSDDSGSGEDYLPDSDDSDDFFPDYDSDDSAFDDSDSDDSSWFEDDSDDSSWYDDSPDSDDSSWGDDW